MILWHILSRERLNQKNVFAQSSNGQLLFITPAPLKDISNGRLGAFLYCLPTLVGGAVFCDSSELTAIRIKLRPSARIALFRGNPDEIPFVALRREYDGLDMLVDAFPVWPIRFRQILLWNPDAIKTWSLGGITDNYQSEYRDLVAGKIPPHDFFMVDFTREEQILQAGILALRLGIEVGMHTGQLEAQHGLEAARNRLVSR